MKEETELKKKSGKLNPFTVPENYFENVVSDIMNKLPEQEIADSEELSLWNRIKPWIYMAAMFCGIMFGLKVLMLSQKNYSSQKVNNKIAAGASDSILYIDECIDPVGKHIMMDDYTLYLYLTDSDSEFNN